MRTINRRLLWAASLSWLAATPALAETVATVDGVAISREEVARTIQQNPALANNPRAGDLALTSLINERLLAKQGEAAGLQRSKAFEEALAAVRRGLLAQAASAKYLQDHPVDDKAIQARYEQIKASAPKKQYRVRHILLSTRDAATEVLDSLKKGEKFSLLASSRSIDTTTAPLGGELGWQQPGSLPKPLTDEIDKMQPGQVAGPVELPNGWDVLQLLQLRDPELPPLERLKPTIEAQLRSEALQAYAKTLRDKADIKITATPSGKAEAK